MSTWTFKACALVAACILTGCDELPTLASGRDAPQTVLVAQNSVVVGGPPGYCVDTGASSDGIKAFVLMGSCASITRNPAAARPALPGLVTVTVSSDPSVYIDVSGSAEAVRRYFTTVEGRTALSRSGDPSSVTIEDVRTVDGAVYLRARDSSAGLRAGLEADYWRALMDVNGRLVTVSVAGFSTRPLSAEEGLFVLDAAAQRIRRESARVASG